jgi:transposase-like protein
MDAIWQARAEQLATEFANQHHTAEDLNGLMRLMMNAALERMLNAELDVHLECRPARADTARAAAPPHRSNRYGKCRKRGL